jgi:RimJ/RimL family protein N-acetyltransferase/uncharacterized RmlC-like cupin family protein
VSERPPFVIVSSQVTEEESTYPPPFDAERLSFGRDLGRAAGSRSLGAIRERLPPGRRSSFTHAHLREEELAYVLSGRPTLRWIPDGGEPCEVVLSPGDFVAFPAGTGIAHTFWNRSGEDAELLVVGERFASERLAYPDDADYHRWQAEGRPLRAWSDATTPSGAARWPAVHVETPRTVLRPWVPTDAQTLLELQGANREHLRPWMIWAWGEPTVDDLLGRIVEWQRSLWSGGDAVLGVFSPDGRAIGGTGLHDRVGQGAREIGYWVHQKHEGKGLVTEWCAALVRLGFEVLELDRMEIRCDPDNARSAAVARRLGFVHEATLPKRAVGVDGRMRDSMVWALYAEDFPKSPLAGIEVRARDAAGRRLL